MAGLGPWLSLISTILIVVLRRVAEAFGSKRPASSRQPKIALQLPHDIARGYGDRAETAFTRIVIEIAHLCARLSASIAFAPSEPKLIAEI